jgi:hypothetical protein
MADNDLVDACFTCGSIKNHKGSLNWEGGDWGGQCKLCMGPVITIQRGRAKEAIKREREDQGL